MLKLFKVIIEFIIFFFDTEKMFLITEFLRKTIETFYLNDFNTFLFKFADFCNCHLHPD